MYTCAPPRPRRDDRLWNCEIVRRMLYWFCHGHKTPEPGCSGLEESGARTAAHAKRPKSIVPEGATRPSLIDFRGPEGHPVWRSGSRRQPDPDGRRERSFWFVRESFRDEHPLLERGGLSCSWARRPWGKTTGRTAIKLTTSHPVVSTARVASDSTGFADLDDHRAPAQ